MDADVLIIGAGAAGLMAARELCKTGKKIIILEARDRIGGRIFPLDKNEFGYPAQGGAEFVHGDAPLTKQLIAECGATLTHGTEWWSIRDGEPQLDVWRPTHEPIILAKLLELERDLSIKEFLNRYFSEPEHAVLREYISRRIEGYWAGNLARASAFALRDELNDPRHAEQHSIREGYTVLLKYLESEVKKYGGAIVLNKEVVRVDIAKRDAETICKDGSIYTAKRTILTVPPPIIEMIEFVPALPDKIAAARAIGYGAAIKILLRFKNRWWVDARQKNFEKLSFMFSDEAIPTWWTQYPDEHATLTGWLAGPAALAFAEKPEVEIVEAALQSLSNIFRVSLGDLRHALTIGKVANWPKDPYALGAYSYPTPETKKAVAELVALVDNKLLFAGEALANGEIAGTVEAALASGKHAAEKILST